MSPGENWETKQLFVGLREIMCDMCNATLITAFKCGGNQEGMSWSVAGAPAQTWESAVLTAAGMPRGSCHSQATLSVELANKGTPSISLRDPTFIWCQTISSRWTGSTIIARYSAACGLIIGYWWELCIQKPLIQSPWSITSSSSVKAGLAIESVLPPDSLFDAGSIQPALSFLYWPSIKLSMLSGYCIAQCPWNYCQCS